MALLSQMIRTVAITGRTDTVNAWFADRQGGRWAEQTVQAAFPQAGPPAHNSSSASAAGPLKDPAERLRDLAELHQSGAVSDAEFEALRARLYR
jgi:Short C-terminal domain